MKKHLLLLCLSLPASASTFHERAPHRVPDRTPHSRADHSRLGDMMRPKSGMFSGRIGHRTTNK